MELAGLVWGEDGVWVGAPGGDLTVNRMVALGGALAPWGKLALGWTGGERAALAARAAGCGMLASGGSVVAHDGGSPTAAAWAAANYDLPLSLFAEQVGEVVYLSLFDALGLPLGRLRQKKPGEAAAEAPVALTKIGQWETVCGVGAACTADGARRVRFPGRVFRGLTAAVPGTAAADRALAATLGVLGCVVLREARPGVLRFATRRGGRTLVAWDEGGKAVSPEQLRMLLCRIELEWGRGGVAVPDRAPAALDDLPRQYGGKVLRPGRDGGAAVALLAGLPWLRDGVFAGARIAAYLGTAGTGLREAVEALPPLALCCREVALGGVCQAAVLAALAKHPRGTEEAGGVRFSDQRGGVSVHPVGRRRALRVVAEGAGAEAAAELCGWAAGQVCAALEGGFPPFGK